MNFVIRSGFLIKFSLYSIFVYQKLDTNVENVDNERKKLSEVGHKSLRSQDYSLGTDYFFFKSEDRKITYKKFGKNLIFGLLNAVLT